MWITPSGIPRYSITIADLVKVNVRTGREVGKRRPSIEKGMHRAVYMSCPKIRAIVHTHSPYTIAVSITSEFRQVIEEARIVAGTPSVISNKPSGSEELARAVATEFSGGARAVVVRNHGVVAAGMTIHHARAVAESLEEWSKILAISMSLGGAKYFLGEP
jgi:ribulose-5-phosphate 4-epimerase/fuculose-1-phosphate aldolase